MGPCCYDAVRPEEDAHTGEGEPALAHQGHLVRKTKAAATEAAAKMQFWLDEVDKMRDGLDRTDRTEGLVYRMLDKEPELRICAADAFELMDSPL